MKALLRAFALWLILAGLATLLALAPEPILTGAPSVAALLVGLPLAAFLTFSAITALPPRGMKRVAFWTMTLLGWAAVGVLMQGRGENSEAARPFLVLGAQLIGVIAGWRMIRGRHFPTWRGIGEVAAAAAIIALLAGGAWWVYEARTRALATQADERWAAIGLPLADFEKTLQASRENDGSKVLREVLRTQVGAIYYKAGTNAALREPQVPSSPAIEELLKRAVEVISHQQTPGDDLTLPESALGPIAARSEALDATYRRLLEVEPATWASDPHDGFEIAVPNFLGIRRLAQLIAADALRREAMGDDEGAARALAAGLRLRRGLVENPTLVSLMIAVAVDGLLSTHQARLPQDGDGFAAIAQDVALQRREYLRRLQMEAWLAQQYLAHPNTTADDALAIHLSSPLPDWADKLVNPPWLRRQCAVAALGAAEHTAIAQDPATLALADLGASRHEEISEKHPSRLEMNTVRARMRIHFVLLVREQAELIRDTRARLAAGLPAEGRDSVVLPGVRWELIADPDRQTVATRLVGAPAWVTTDQWMPSTMWLVRIDGSEPWRFRTTPRVAGQQ